jgi:hypothetical protein
MHIIKFGIGLIVSIATIITALKIIAMILGVVSIVFKLLWLAVVLSLIALVVWVVYRVVFPGHAQQP